MKVFLTLLRKELRGYFFSSMAYTVSVLFLVVMGYAFTLLCSALASGVPGVSAMAIFFSSPFYWIIMLIVCPLLTMRLLAEEKRSGTIETLLTAPISDLSVALAKYAGVLIFYIFMWAPTLAYMFILEKFSSAMAPVDMGALFSAYLGVLLIGALYLAIGLFCSSLTSNALVAGIASFAALITLFFTGVLETAGTGERVRAFARHVSAYAHMSEFLRGSIDSRAIVFYLTCTIFVLFLTVRSLESRRWK